MMYKIVSYADISKVEREVNKLITIGWKLEGGIAITVQFTSIWYAQALTFEEPTDLTRFMEAKKNQNSKEVQYEVH